MPIAKRNAKKAKAPSTEWSNVKVLSLNVSFLNARKER